MISISRLLLTICASFCLMLAACASTPSPTPVTETTASTPLSCKTADDCLVKNVGNCCGYAPACVHKDQAVDPAAVTAQCKAEGRSSVCGFQDISACACVDGHCAAAPASGIDSRLP